MAVLDADRTLEPHPRAAHDARDVRAAVEQGRQRARSVRDLAGQYRVPLDRLDLDHPDPALHDRPPRTGQRPDRADPRDLRRHLGRQGVGPAPLPLAPPEAGPGPWAGAGWPPLL